MIQLQLLPDVKIEFLKTRLIKRLVFLSSILVIAISLIVTGVVFTYVSVAQKQHIDNLNDDINSAKSKIAAVNNLNRILTVQQQLQSLPGLHDQKPIVSRFFDYFNQLTPDNISISRSSINNDNRTIEIAGSAPSLEAVNVYADTFKFAQYELNGTRMLAFSRVVTTVGKADNRSSFSLNLEFDPVLFDFGSKDVKLVVDRVVTTRSDPNQLLFEQTAEQQR